MEKIFHLGEECFLYSLVEKQLTFVQVNVKKMQHSSKENRVQQDGQKSPVHKKSCIKKKTRQNNERKNISADKT